MNINTTFDINQRVYISELKIWGTIQNIWVSHQIKYNVRFFDGCDAKECYFLETELSTIDNAGIGFSIK